MLLPWVDEAKVPWVETKAAKTWAAKAFLVPPPPLHSEERSLVLTSISEHLQQIEDICLQSFWKDDSANMQLEIDRLRRKIAQNRARIAPWRLLPNELLSSVFESMREEYVSTVPIGHTISQVCRKWREVTITTPKCWADIYISPTSVKQQLLKRWLNRSKNVALNVQVVEPSESSHITLLGKHMHRVSRFDFVPRYRFTNVLWGWSQEENPYFPLEKNIYSALRKASKLVELKLPSGFYRGNPVINVKAPSLYELNIFKGTEFWDLKGLTPCSTLTHASLRDTELKSDFCTLIENLRRIAPNIESVELARWALSLDDSRPDRTMPHPHIRALVLPRHEKLHAIISRAAECLPALSMLSISSSELPSDCEIPNFPNLITLCVRQPSTSHKQDGYDQWLSAAPNLRYLILGLTIWVEYREVKSLARKLYERPHDDDFSWFKLDQARLYAWPHPWCISIAKKQELRIYEHVLSNCYPLANVKQHQFPYTLSLSYSELREKLAAIATGTVDEEGVLGWEEL